MAFSAPRRQVSTASRHEVEYPKLRNLLERLNTGTRTQVKTETVDQSISEIETRHQIRQLLLDEPESKDGFRQLGGFEAFLDNCSLIVRWFCEGINATELAQEYKELLEINFNILTASLREHRCNRRYFAKRVRYGGWESLNQVLQPFFRSNHAFQISGPIDLRDRIFGCLLACALDDETLVHFYNKINNRDEAYHGTSEETELPCHKDEVYTTVNLARMTPSVCNLLAADLDSNAFLYNPEALMLSFNLWKSSVSASKGLTDFTGCNHLLLPIVIKYIMKSSSQCLIATHNTDLLTSLLPCLTSLKLHPEDMAELRSLALTLLSLGITRLDDAAFLYRNANSSPVVADLVLPTLQMSHLPSYVHFDLSLYGFSSIELSDIGHSFPPMNSSHGYTLSIWLYVVKFDINAHTTLFGAFDSSQTCFVLVYLERDTQNLILQTSVTSSRPSVRFKSVSFREKQWYHLVIAHQKPKATSSSRASLFVNGEFVEQVKSHYPLVPPSNKTTAETQGHGTTSRKHNPVQVFFGTPQDLALRLGKGLVSTEWRLGSAHLIGDVLSDDLVAVYFELGPRYYGNYQDCLGSFNTYRAAASLKLRNQKLHPGREQDSDIIAALEHRGSRVLPESRIIISLSPSNILGEESQENTQGAQISKYFSKPALRTLKNLVHQRSFPLIVNGSVPSINQALLYPYGFAVFTGNPLVAIAQPLDNATWRIDGCTSVGLSLLEQADTEERIIRALEFTLENIRENWRNSEAMEKENGFGVLAGLLSSKLEDISSKYDSERKAVSSVELDERKGPELPLKVLRVITSFLGYRADKAEESMLNNPLAYRTLLVDADYWRDAPPSVQRLYYEQFTVFAVQSKYRHFNNKRLSRMR